MTKVRKDKRLEEDVNFLLQASFLCMHFSRQVIRTPVSWSLGLVRLSTQAKASLLCQFPLQSIGLRLLHRLPRPDYYCYWWRSEKQFLRQYPVLLPTDISAWRATNDSSRLDLKLAWSSLPFGRFTSQPRTQDQFTCGLTLGTRLFSSTLRFLKHKRNCQFISMWKFPVFFSNDK